MKEGWKEVRLGEVCLPTKNVNWKNNTNSFKYIDLTSVSRLTHKIIGETALITADNAPSRAKQIVKCDDLIFGTTRPTLRRFCLITHEYDKQICSTGFCVLRPDQNNVLSKFLYYIFSFNDIYTYLEPLQKGANYPAVTNKNVLDYPLPLPPLPEQQRIVAVLDSVFASIEQMKQNAKTNLLNAQAVLKNALDEMMQMKEGWEKVRLGEVCDFIRGPFGGSLKKSCFVTQGIPVYEQQNAIYSKFNFRYFITEEKYKEMERFRVQRGDLIMSCSGTIGKVAIVPDSAPLGIINQALLKLTAHTKRLNPYFLMRFMNSTPFIEAIYGTLKGVAIQNVPSVKVLKELRIFLPPLSEQQRIVSILDDLSEKCKRLERNYRRIIDDCEEMKQAVLTRAMNGEL